MKSLSYLLILLFVFSSTSIYSQNAYYDAIALSNFLIEDEDEGGKRFNTDKVDTVEKWTNILARYLNPDKNYTTSQVMDCYLGIEEPYEEENPFFEGLINPGGLQSSGVESFLRVKPQKKSAFSAIGGMKVSRFSDGLAQFLIERSKEEIYVSYFEKLQETFKRYPEFPLLLSQSSDFLQLFESYQYAAMVPALREAVKKDIENIPSRMLGLKHLPEEACGYTEGDCKGRIAEYQNFFKKGESKMFTATTILLDQLIQGANPAELLETLATHQDFVEVVDSHAAQNFVNGVKMMQFFSANLRHVEEDGESYEEETEEDERLWVTKSEWKKLNRPTLRIYLGLLYQKPEAAEIQFFVDGEAKSLRAILGDFAGNINPIESFLTGMLNKTEALDKHLKTIEQKKEALEEFSPRDYYTYFEATLDLLKHLLTIEKAVSGIKVGEEVQGFTDLAEIGGDIYYDLHTRNFSTAVLNVVLFLDKAMKSDFNESAFRTQFLKYGTFMSALADAEDAVGAKTVIESMVLPVGSSRIKRDTKSNVALNAYLGAFGAGEYLTELDSWKSTIGIYAPVGVSFSQGIKKKVKGSKKSYESGGSWTLFLSVIDIGAVTAYRMDDDSTEALPELKLQNILAPGLQIIKGCANSPMSWGVGIQAGPILRKIRNVDGLEPDAVFNSKLNYRIQAFLAVDIPLINFKTKPW